MNVKQKTQKGLLQEVIPHITELLNNAPDFGQCGIEIIFHEGSISRVITKTEESQKIEKRRYVNE